MKRSTRKPAYDVHPGLALVQSMFEKLQAETGRSFDEWVALTKKSGPREERARREWLKAMHGLGTNRAALIAELASGGGQEKIDSRAYVKTAKRWVDEMFSGPREGLRPIFEEVLTRARSLGKDVRICPGKSIVPIYRNHVIAQLKPSTRTRLDLGLALGSRKPTKRLLDTGGHAKKDRITHRVGLESVTDVDDEVMRWLKEAYDRDA